MYIALVKPYANEWNEDFIKLKHFKMESKYGTEYAVIHYVRKEIRKFLGKFSKENQLQFLLVGHSVAVFVGRSFQKCVP